MIFKIENMKESNIIYRYLVDVIVMLEHENSSVQYCKAYHHDCSLMDMTDEKM